VCSDIPNICDRELLDGRAEIAEFCVPHVGKMSLHADMTAARGTIFKVRTLERDYGVRTLLAHDVSWMIDKADDLLLSLCDENISSQETRSRINRGEIP
jgi:hypothetical protein